MIKRVNQAKPLERALFFGQNPKGKLGVLSASSVDLGRSRSMENACIKIVHPSFVSGHCKSVSPQVRVAPAGPQAACLK
jgi:hypothetical protein